MFVKEDDTILACFLIFLINVLSKIYNVVKFQLLNKSLTKDFFIVITMQVLMDPFVSHYIDVHQYWSFVA
jgi:hypothetical protein